MALPDPALLTLDYIKAHHSACDEYRARCRFHPIIDMIEKAIAAGHLPVRGMEPNDSLFWHRGTGAFSFKDLHYRESDQTVIIGLDIAVYREDEGDEVKRNEWFYLPAALLVPKPSVKLFNSWCKEKREAYLVGLEKHAEHVVTRAKEARAKPTKPGSHSSWG